jgi:hypothetical protein
MRCIIIQRKYKLFWPTKSLKLVPEIAKKRTQEYRNVLLPPAQITWPLYILQKPPSIIFPTKNYLAPDNRCPSRPPPPPGQPRPTATAARRGGRRISTAEAGRRELGVRGARAVREDRAALEGGNEHIAKFGEEGDLGAHEEMRWFQAAGTARSSSVQSSVLV